VVVRKDVYEGLAGGGDVVYLNSCNLYHLENEMKSQQYHFLFLFLQGLSAAPTKDKSNGRQPHLPRDIDIIKTTEHSDGSVIDWIPIDSQVPDGKIASAPPLPAYEASFFNQSTFQPWALLQDEGAETGPEGTVPVLRPAAESPLTKGPPVDLEHEFDFDTEAVGDHWYASSAQGVSNRGGSASFSLYKAWTESNSDFSLLQSAVIRYDVPKPGDNSQLVRQTVEAGWYAYDPL
jgi:hypothetical protein